MTLLALLVRRTSQATLKRSGSRTIPSNKDKRIYLRHRKGSSTKMSVDVPGRTVTEVYVKTTLIYIGVAVAIGHFDSVSKRSSSALHTAFKILLFLLFPLYPAAELCLDLVLPGLQCLVGGWPPETERELDLGSSRTMLRRSTLFPQAENDDAEDYVSLTSRGHPQSWERSSVVLAGRIVVLFLASSPLLTGAIFFFKRLSYGKNILIVELGNGFALLSGFVLLMQTICFLAVQRRHPSQPKHVRKERLLANIWVAFCPYIAAVYAFIDLVSTGKSGSLSHAGLAYEDALWQLKTGHSEFWIMPFPFWILSALVSIYALLLLLSTLARFVAISLAIWRAYSADNILPKLPSFGSATEHVLNILLGFAWWTLLVIPILYAGCKLWLFGEVVGEVFSICLGDVHEGWKWKDPILEKIYIL